MDKLKTYTALIIAMILWGGSFVWAKEALQVFDVYTITFFRLLISAIVLLSYGFAVKISFKLKKEDIKWFVLLALFEPVLYFIGETNGLKTVSPTVTSVIISTIPVFVLISAYFIYNEKLKPINIAGAIISFAGVLFIVVNKEFELDSPLSGILLVFLAVFSATGYSIVLQKLSGKYRPMVIVAYQSSIAVPFFAVLFFVNDFNSFSKIELHFQQFIPIIKLGILASSFAYMLFTFGIKKIGVSRAGLFSNAIPLFTAIFSYFLFDEKLEAIKYLGMFLVIFGLMMSQIDNELYKKIAKRFKVRLLGEG